MRTFELNDGTSRKFWNIAVKDKTFTVTFGKIGTKGQSQTKTFKDAATAQAEADKLIKEKTKKGYKETTQRALASEEDAFQKALVANPDDLAGWCAYADYLVEKGDPRGEFMQTQIALEDENRPKKERTALKKKEQELLAKHEKDWLGGLAPYVFKATKTEEDEEEDYDDYAPKIEYVWRCGFLSQLTVGRLTMAVAQLLASDPVTRFVRELHIHKVFNGHYVTYAPKQPKPRVKTPKGAEHHSELFELIGSPLFTNLRVFQMGGEIPPADGWCDCHTYASGLAHAVAAMPRVEVLDLYCKEYDSGALYQLTNLTHLRELRIYHLGGRARAGFNPIYPLNVLANNPVFANLTHLLFHPHLGEDLDNDGPISYIPVEQVRALVRSPHLKKLTHLQLRLSDMGDDGVREIIASGILKQLKWLDLRGGRISDGGAKLLAACPDAKHLEHLDLSRNAVTSAGLRALRKAGVKAVANDPFTDHELDHRQYLFEGDGE
jgi:uncharacterized protein (TIGR02996 family)